MSKETLTWLNTNTLIGFTDKRGNAWHYREGGDNHYPGAIPLGDVHRRLFDWEAEEHPLYAETGRDEFAFIPGRKAIVRSDTGHVMGIFKDGYQPHQYGEWLLDNVANILDDDLQIGSAGLLRDGAIAWVSVEVPENIVTPEGVAFRPFLMARTSFDGSVATTYGRHVTNVVCDNTMDIASRQHGGQQFKVRHSAKSLGRLTEARDALGIVHGIADHFAAQVAELSAVKVSDQVFWQIVVDAAPMPKNAEKAKAQVTLAEKKRDRLMELWKTDERVAPWRGTGFGAWQAFNTYLHHETQVRKGAARAERNMLRAIDGEVAKADAETVRRIMSLAA